MVVIGGNKQLCSWHQLSTGPGGAGALLNHAAVKVLLGMWEANDQDCTAHDEWARQNAGKKDDMAR